MLRINTSGRGASSSSHQSAEWETYMSDDRKDQVTQQVLQGLQTAAPHPAMSGAQLQQLATDIVAGAYSFQAQLDAADAHQIGARLAGHGVSVHAVMQVSRALLPNESAKGITPDTIWAYISEVGASYVAAIKHAAQEATINEFQATQQREDQLRAVIQELSTPIIPIYRGVLVLPLVGAIDSMRSQEITERLLEEIVRQQADMVIIDITGVSVVDTSVANHLIMTAQAVNLLGSKVIFTGISSTIAQTIIQLGVNLGDVVTLSNLQAGMLYALEQMGLEITELATA